MERGGTDERIERMNEVDATDTANTVSTEGTGTTGAGVVEARARRPAPVGSPTAR
ncbi:hypothetical protein SHIRM173S_05323 [Streptomyces hirsutus]